MGNRKIPTFLGILMVLFLVAGVAFVTGGIDKARGFLTSASGNPPPSSVVEVANITDSSFVVFWTTVEPSGGAVFFGKTPELEAGVAVDERDLGGESGDYKTHFVRVNGLSEKTKYYFKVGQTEPSFSQIETVTAPTLSTNSELESLSGSAVLANGDPVSDGVAIWQSPGSAKIAALVNTDGTFVLPLNLARNANLDSWFPSEVGNPEKVLVLSGDSEGTVNCLTGESSTLLEVRLGQTLDCSPTATPSGSFKSLLGSPSQASASGEASLNIESGESVSTGLPTFTGKVGPKQVVKIVIHSEEVYSGTVIADSKGAWSWTPPANLTPGEHTVTITVVNADGTTQTVTKTFFVTAGESILPLTSGTPSGEISTTPTPTDELIESGVETPTLLALTLGLLFTILSAGIIFTSF